MGVKGTTWNQALQLMPIKAISRGQELQIRARHDTYGISFEYKSFQEEQTKVSHRFLVTAAGQRGVSRAFKDNRLLHFSQIDL